MLKFIVALTLVFAASVSFAQAAIPEVLGAGLTLGSWMTLAIAAMGALVVTALGGMVAFLGIRKGFSWVRRSIG